MRFPAEKTSSCIWNRGNWEEENRGTRIQENMETGEQGNKRTSEWGNRGTGEQGNKGFPVFSGRNIPNGNSCSISTKPSVSFPRGRFFDKWNWFVQMVNETPGQNLTVVNFAYHFLKLWSDWFSHLNCKQPPLSRVSGSLFQMRKSNYDTDLPKTCIVDTGWIGMQQ